MICCRPALSTPSLDTRCGWLTEIIIYFTFNTLNKNLKAQYNIWLTCGGWRQDLEDKWRRHITAGVCYN